MKILIIDNYDSFTYNLYQYIGEAVGKHRDSTNARITVIRNDEWTIDKIRQYNADRIIISPGPGSPTEEAYFGVSMACITQLGPSTPILGVCLGMQGIAYAFGASVVKATVPMHGKVSPIRHDGSVLFHDIPQGVEIMRYHSLIVDTNTLPDCLIPTASTCDLANNDLQTSAPISLNSADELMGIQHKEFPIYGIQFHPESFGSEGGREMLSNFLFLSSKKRTN